MYFFYFGAVPDSLPDATRSFLLNKTMTWDDIERILSIFRSHHPELTLGTFQTFIYVARRAAVTAATSDPVTIKSVAEALKMPYPTAARHCDILSAGLAGKLGLNWISKTSMLDGKSKRLQLTNVGLQLLMSAVNADS